MQFGRDYDTVSDDRDSYEDGATSSLPVYSLGQTIPNVTSMLTIAEGEGVYRIFTVLVREVDDPYEQLLDFGRGEYYPDPSFNYYFKVVSVGNLNDYVITGRLSNYYTDTTNIAIHVIGGVKIIDEATGQVYRDVRLPYDILYLGGNEEGGEIEIVTSRPRLPWTAWTDSVEDPNPRWYELKDASGEYPEMVNIDRFLRDYRQRPE